MPAPKSITLNDPKVINGWAFFDWANSAYALVITVAIFPGYFSAVTDDVIQIGGVELYSSSLYAYAISFSYLIAIILSPVLSGIADYGGRKKFFLRIFTTLGALACMSLFFFEGMSQLWLGIGGSVLASVGFAGGLVFYNSYLPEIATEDQYDRVSARGFIFGFVGSVLLLLVNLMMIQKPEWFGISDSNFAVRLSFLMVGVWWLSWSLIPFNRLPADQPIKGQGTLVKKGFEELKKVYGKLKNLTNTKRFLLAFFFYNAGTQTVLYLAATFAEKELQFETQELIITILILQILAIAGAFLFARLSEWKGNKLSLLVMLVIWIAICLLAYLVQGKTQFYGIAAAVGLVMGGIQSLSRSTYSKLLPENTEDTTSFFSFYDVLEKGAIIMGTFSFGLIEQLTGGMRNSILALTVYFIIGIVILLTVQIKNSN
ncbi:MAG: MFS transporter [Saprospiraceae bacterium]